MNRSILLATLLLFCFKPGAFASSIEFCEYELKIQDQSATSVSVSVLKIVVSNGFNASFEKLRCEGKIKAGKIPVDQISEGKSLLKLGEKLKARWSSYSAMTPKGPISGINWKFSKL